MKKLILTIVALFTLTIAANAMSYEQARQQALFLADKMAYELNLTEEQYEAVYEINLDYLMSINTRDDLYGMYWRQRNLDMSYILLDWQYRAFCNAAYFYRPLYWDAGYWHFAVYARYPHRTYLYFGRPTFWTVYRGGHSWRMNGGRSWYHGRDLRPRHSGHHTGMRDHFDRKDRNGHNKDFGRNNRPDNRTFGNQHDRNRNEGHFGSRDNNRDNSRNEGRFGSRDNNRDNNRFGNDDNRGQNNRTFGNNNDRYQNNSVGRSNNPNGRESSTRTTVSNRDNRRFNGSRSGDVYNRSSSSHRERPTATAPSSSTRSTFGSSSRPSGSRNSFGSSSHSSGSRSSFGSSSRSSGSRGSFGGGSSGSCGGGHFGGRR